MSVHEKKFFDVGGTERSVRLYNVAVSEMEKAFRGLSNQFFFNLDHYFSLDDVLYNLYVELGVDKLRYAADRGKWRVGGNFFELVNPLYYALFGALEDFVSVGIDMDSENLSSALYTRDFSFLHSLSLNNMLANSSFSRFENVLYGQRTLDSVFNGKFTVVRLDVVEVGDDHVLFNAVVPDNDVDLLNRHIFIPVPLFYRFEDVLEWYYGDKAFRFVEYVGDNRRTGVVTMSPKVLMDVYNDDFAVDRRVNSLACKYNVFTRRFDVFDLEEPVSSLGVTHFRPELLDYLEEVDINTIDRSRHGIDYNILRQIFKSKLNNLKADELRKLNIVGLDDFANMKDKVSAVNRALEYLSDKDFYFIMKGNSSIFGDVDSLLERRKHFQPKFLKNMTKVELPSTVDLKEQTLRGYLRDGVIRVILYSKNGTPYEFFGSNNPKVLERMLGKDYVKKFESIRGRLLYVRKYIESRIALGKKDLEKLIVEYDLADYINHDVFLDTSSKDNQLNEIVRALNTLDEREYYNGSSFGRGLVVCRNIYARGKKDFFKTIDVNKIKWIYYSKFK